MTLRRSMTLTILITLALALFLPATLSPIVPSGRTSAAGDPWPMFGHDERQANRAAANGPNSADIKWTFTDGVGAFLDPVVGPDGTVYAWGGGLYAINPDGTKKWSITGHERPAVANNGNVIAIKDAPYTASLVGLNPANGAELWAFYIGVSYYGHPVIGADGTIYITGKVNADYTLFAVNPGGTQKWAATIYEDYGGGIREGSAVAVGPNGNVYVNEWTSLIGVSSTGTVLWDVGESSLGCCGNAPTVGPDGTVYIGSNGFYFYAINPDGTIKWQRRFTVNPGDLTGMMDFSGSAITADGSLIMRGSNNGFFEAYRTEGGYIAWTFDVPNSGIPSQPALAANDLVYFTADVSYGADVLYALRVSDGAIIWQYPLGPWGDRPALGADGTLYVPGSDANGNGVLHAFRCADGTCTVPPHDPVHVVTNLNDSGAGSLRQAVLDAVWDDTITFANGLTGTITLQSEIDVQRKLTITGPGADKIIISGGLTNRLFDVGIPEDYKVKNDDIPFTISGLTLANGKPNYTFDYGGAIYSRASTVMISNVVFTGNVGRTYSDPGAPLYNDGGVMTITNCTFTNNGSSGTAGAIYNTGYVTFDDRDISGTVYVLNSTFNDNSTTAWGSGGGAIYNGKGSITVANSTFYNNTSMRNGGAISNGVTAPITIINSTFEGNSTSGTVSGGALAGNFVLRNTIIGNNPSWGGTCEGTITDGGGNVQYPLNDCGATIPVGDPKLGPLANNGGPTQTMALQWGSAAIDAGNTATCGNVPVSNLDQRGVIRPTDGDGNGTALCDAGAFEAPRAVLNDTVGIFRPSNATFYLRNSNTTGPANITALFGAANDQPVAGDWNGDGVDTIGVYRNGTFYLKDTNSTGAPVVYTFTLGNPGDLPMAGDWDGNGTDGAGTFRPTNGRLYLKNALTTGFADFAMVLGINGDRPVAGDWNGDGMDSPGVYRPSNSRFYLTNQRCNCIVYADYSLLLGNVGDVGFAGDWDGDGRSGVGVFRPSNGITYLKNALTTGFADVSMIYGIANDRPIAGHWVAGPYSAPDQMAPEFAPGQ